MHFLTVFFLLGVIMPLSYILFCKILPCLMQKNATAQLDSLLFPEGNHQKQEMIKEIHEITGNRFKDEEILDYYYKIKGLRMLGKNIKLNFCLKKYFFSSTKIKLNYFEQRRFYETFLHHPTLKK